MLLPIVYNLFKYMVPFLSVRWLISSYFIVYTSPYINAWLLYKRTLCQQGKKKEILDQAGFRAEVAKCLCSVNCTNIKRTRSSEVEREIQIKKKKGPTHYIPPQDIRRDQTGHWPVPLENKMRCKYPKCTSFTRMKCSKCGVGLCLNRNNNCFLNFHVN